MNLDVNRALATVQEAAEAASVRGDLGVAGTLLLAAVTIRSLMAAVPRPETKSDGA